MSDVAITVDGWAARVRPHLVAAVGNIVAAGQELTDAKTSLGHGHFGELLNELGLTPRTAQRFMAIAGHPVLSNATHASHLPAAWTTLHELSRAEPEQLEAAIGRGDVGPNLDRHRARQLVVCLNLDTVSASKANALGTLECQIREAQYRLGVLLRSVTQLDGPDATAELLGVLVDGFATRFPELLDVVDPTELLECAVDIVDAVPEPDFARPWHEQMAEATG